MTEDAKQKLVDILSKSPDLIGQDSSFFGSESKPNEANLKLFMKFTRERKNKGEMSKETVDINKFIDFLSKNGKSEEELGKISSSLKELSRQSQVVETDAKSTLFDLADALLVYGVKGDKTISKFQTALKSILEDHKTEEGTEEGSQEEKPEVNIAKVAPSTVDQEGAKKDTPPEDSSYSGGSYDEGGGATGANTESTTGDKTESKIESKTETEIEIEIDSKTKATTIGTYAIMNTESTVKKYPDLPESLKDIKPREIRDKEGKLIGFISDDESNKSVYDQSGEIIGQLDPTDKSVGGFEGLSVVLKPNVTVPETPQTPEAPATPQTPQVREEGAGEKRIPTESGTLSPPTTGPTSRIEPVPTGLTGDAQAGAKDNLNIPKFLRKKKAKGIIKKGSGNTRMMESPQSTKPKRKAKGKGKGKDEQESQAIPTTVRDPQSTIGGRKKKKKKGKVGKIVGGTLLGGAGTLKATTAATVAGEIFKQIIEIIT